ncbi:DUF397 domain-containing protein [Actinomadura logoneensis]|uniref:DUF397 domain-containing protein n=1 Tax=Actinomadura logoneensis TaxID=2293572 RepID=A0A372JPD0_9ACTN|nr:DUF397 domain-containing protein [Actinomadura logoneensis]RFU41820.1 DUF397 domain-containing protein [Actinomadura logoneensis]
MITERDQFSDWRKSSRSGDSRDCVEVGRTASLIGFADTKRRGRGVVLGLERPLAAEFLAAVKVGRYDLD